MLPEEQLTGEAKPRFHRAWRSGFAYTKKLRQKIHQKNTDHLLKKETGSMKSATYSRFTVFQQDNVIFIEDNSIM